MTPHLTRSPARLALAAAALTTAAGLVACRQGATVTLGDLAPLVDGSTVATHGEISVAVQSVDNPGQLTLEYRWAATRGTFRTASPNVPAATFIAGDVPGTETVTLEVLHDGKLLDTRSMQVEVVVPASPAPTARAQPPVRGTPAPASTPATSAAAVDTPGATGVPGVPASAPAPPTVEHQAGCAPAWEPLSLSPLAGAGTIDLAPCQTVPATLNVRGGYAGVADSTDLWLLIGTRGGDERWWPQAAIGTIGPALKVDGDTWESLASFGAPNGWFDVALVVADEDATRAFQAWHDRGRATNDYPGWARADLPAGIDQKAVVTVFRRH